MKNRLLFSLLLLAVALFYGCGKNPASPYPVSIGSPDDAFDYNNELFAAVQLNPDRSDYLLGPGDLLEIRVLEDEKLNSTTRISSRGYISVPLLDDVSIEGLTASEAEQFIEDRYRKQYIKDPHVSIFIREHFSQRVTVAGQVKNPGTYDYPSRQRLLDAIALAGGLTENASQEIQVHRSTSDEKNRTLVINLEDLIKGGKAHLNIGINGGDIIYVPEAGSFFVDGAVRRPGEYHIRQATSVEEAIITAGGFESFAKTDQIIILRPTADGKREELKIDTKNNLTANRFTVQDRDIILVNASFWGKLVHGAGLNLGIPGTGISYRPGG